MKSRVYEGSVFHFRKTPEPHRFNYDVCLLYLDLDELPELFEPYWLWSAKRAAIARFERRHHCGDPQTPLKASVSALVEDATGQACEGPIRLLTHPSYFGFAFNPVSFYYCFDQEDAALQTIVAEVNNTPWGEQHCYVLECKQSARHEKGWRFKFTKDFHVSPFMVMSQAYDWQFTPPESTLRVHMGNLEGGQRIFTAGLSLQGQPVSSCSLRRALVNYPFMTGKVIGGIYWQALRLWMKGVPFNAHPKYQNTTEAIE